MGNLAITATAVIPTTTAIKVIKLAAGVTVTQGQAAAMDSSGNGTLCDSNGVAPLNALIGIYCSAGSPGQYVTYCDVDAAFANGASGMAVAPVYVSNTAGSFTQTLGDLAAGSTIIVAGVAVSGTVLNLTPATGVTSLAGVTS